MSKSIVSISEQQEFRHITEPLSLLLRESTKDIHRSVERSRFVNDLFSGRVSASQYAAYIEALTSVYAVLESELLKSSALHGFVRDFFESRLFRIHALEKDLKYWRQYVGEVPRSSHVERVVEGYTSRIRWVSANRPTSLLAHSYVRHLGDVSGGQILGRKLARYHPSDHGLFFYDMEGVDICCCKTRYRKGLDLMGTLYYSHRDGICREAQVAFEWNARLFSSLDNVSTGDE